MNHSKISANYILHLGSYPPRECGIATFTADLVNALNKKFNPVVKTRVIAINDQPTSIYHYNNNVVHQITATELEHYVALAREINKREDVRLVNIQHEFGIFGGDWGDYLLPFLQAVEKPIIITFHSVLSDPDEKLRNVVRSVVNQARVAVVMNKLSQEILENNYEISKSKIALIPHGIPQVPFEPSDKFKQDLGLENRMVLSTFGMLGPGKGIEHVIRALPKVVKKFPNVIYLVIGATHPNVRKEEGEEYRNFLIREVEKLKLDNNVKFYNKYLTLEEIIQYLKATDVYVSSNVDLGQSVSGTLSYAMGCGRPIISTATAYAKWIIDETNGILVKPKNHSEISAALINILSDSKYMKSMSAAAYEKSRQMIWPNVATQYFNLYKKHASIETEEKKLPEIKFDHLARLTDDFGIIHHAKYSKPAKRYGYSLDDNARALLACNRYYRINPDESIMNLMKIYLRFMKFTAKPSGYFSNIVSFGRHRDSTKDDDVLGRAIWALGYASASDFLSEEIRAEAEKLFNKAVKPVLRFKSPRSIAFALMGLYFYLKRHPKKSLEAVFKKLANRQLAFYENFASPEWQWFEDKLTYSNSRLPESLFYAYDFTNDKKYLKVAEKTLNFLSKITFLRNYYAPIGQNGWYFRNKQRSYFDQQPEDAASMAETKVAAYKITKDKKYLEDAFRAFQWFLGKNNLNQMVYDEATGGCHDGVGQYAMNLNQGAESTISYLLARLTLESVINEN
ncbi:glycosyltransferase [Candidatus Wolfebacteria bacterium]|nr:glycosyltransferase [Candidatus Wolfebacteria bacterium]